MRNIVINFKKRKGKFWRVDAMATPCRKTNGARVLGDSERLPDCAHCLGIFLIPCSADSSKKNSEILLKTDCNNL